MQIRKYSSGREIEGCVKFYQGNLELSIASRAGIRVYDNSKDVILFEASGESLEELTAAIEFIKGVRNAT